MKKYKWQQKKIELFCRLFRCLEKETLFQYEQDVLIEYLRYVDCGKNWYDIPYIVTVKVASKSHSEESFAEEIANQTIQNLKKKNNLMNAVSEQIVDLVVDQLNNVQLNESLTDDAVVMQTAITQKETDLLREHIGLNFNNSLEDTVTNFALKVIEDRNFKLLQSQNISSGLLPTRNGCILYKKSGKKEIYVLQYEPCVKKITLHQSILQRYEETNFVHQIAVPWMVFVMSFENRAFESMYAYFSPKRITSLQNKLYHPTLPNIFDSGEVCLNLGNLEFNSTSHSAIIEQIISYFWTSTFNDDVEHYCKQMEAVKFENFTDWSNKSDKIIRRPDLFHWETNRTLSEAIFTDKPEQEMLEIFLKHSPVLEQSILNSLADTQSSYRIEALDDVVQEYLDRLDKELINRVDDNMKSVLSSNLLDELFYNELRVQLKDNINKNL